MQTGPGGTTFSRTGCISSDNPLPPMARESSVSGGTVSWALTCTAPQVTLHEEWIVHYHGETLDGNFTIRSALGGHSPIERSQPITGRYLGPCDAN